MNQRPAGKKRQIVVCAPSNKAICVVLEQVLFFARNNGRRLKCALAGIEGRIEDCATMLQSRHSTESILRSFQCPKSAIDVFAFRFSSNLLRALDDLDWYCQPLCSINLEKCECEYEEDGYEKTLLCSHCIKLPKGAIFLSKGTVAGRSALDVGFTTKERYAGLMNMMIDIAPALEKAKKLAGNRHAMRRDVKALAQLFRVLAKRIAIAVLIMTGDTELLKVVEAASECYGRKTFSESQFSYHSVSKMPVDDEYSEEAVQFQLNEIIKCVKELKVSLGPRGGSTYSDNQREVDEAFISAADIVFCTLGTSGSACVRKRCDIDVMVVDEAAQASEAELIVSLDLLPNHLILVGDPAQLPAFITSSAAQRKGCGMSAMERLLDRCAYDHCFLDTQYRMHPSISAWPNKTFYNSRLLDSEHVQTRSNALLACVKHRFISALPRWLSTPCAFLNMHDSSNERRWGTSYANHREAIMISKIIKYMLDVCDIDVHKQLCVITFYVGQVKAIKESLQKAGLGGLNIRVLTVDSFQG